MSDEAPPPGEDVASSPTVLSRLTLPGAVLLLAALVVAAVLLGLRDHDHRSSNGSSPEGTSAEQAALSAARAEAVALTTISYQTADRDLGRVLAGATGALRTQFEKERRQLPATLAQNKSVSRGTVLAAGLASLSGTSARALVAVDATVSGTDVGGSGVLKHYRMVVDLRHVGDRWLADDVSFAGLPQ